MSVVIIYDCVVTQSCPAVCHGRSGFPKKLLFLVVNVRALLPYREGPHSPVHVHMINVVWAERVWSSDIQRTSKYCTKSVLYSLNKRLAVHGQKCEGGSSLVLPSSLRQHQSTTHITNPRGLARIMLCLGAAGIDARMIVCFIRPYRRLDGPVDGWLLVVEDCMGLSRM
jgi:hypothetical protein